MQETWLTSTWLLENQNLGNSNSSLEIFIRYMVNETEDLQFVYFILKEGRSGSAKGDIWNAAYLYIFYGNINKLNNLIVSILWVFGLRIEYYLE